MKRILLLLSVLPWLAQAQKEIKPSVNKAETALQKGSIEEAKSIIDVTVASQEFMLDKKGQPAKNASKAWYLKGLVYVAIDTSKVEKIKSLDPNPFVVAKEAFAKAEELDKGKNESLVSAMYPGTQLPVPMTKDQVAKSLAQKYLERGYAIYQKKDYKAAFGDIEKVLFFVPTDTAQLMNAGVYFAPAAEEIEKAIGFIKRYQAAGGQNPDAVVQLYSIYTKKADQARAKYKENKDPKAYLSDTTYLKNINAALGTAKELTSKYPNNLDYLNLEYNIYTSTNRLPEAKALMEKRAKADPNNKESRYLLGLISFEMKDFDGAKSWMNEAIKIDPDYFEANLVLAKLSYTDAQKLRNERNAITGSKDADLKKRQELFRQIPGKLKESAVYWEKCATINPSDADALYGLLSIYNDISLYDETYNLKITELKKKMKALGLEVD
jgi:tetratricopeptide (TPR) repeat protein